MQCPTMQQISKMYKGSLVRCNVQSETRTYSQPIRSIPDPDHNSISIWLDRSGPIGPQNQSEQSKPKFNQNPFLKSHTHAYQQHHHHHPGAYQTRRSSSSSRGHTGPSVHHHRPGGILDQAFIIIIQGAYWTRRSSSSSRPLDDDDERLVQYAPWMMMMNAWSSMPPG